MFYSVPYCTVQTVETVNGPRKRIFFLFLLVICLVFTPSGCVDWAEGLDNSVQNGIAWIIGDSKSQPDKYFQIQSHRSQKYLTAMSNSNPDPESKTLLDKNYLGDYNKIWTVHSTLGFPFINGSFAPLFEISHSSSSSPSSSASQKTNYILNNLRIWRLELVRIKDEIGETFIIYRPFNNSCLVETENFQDETHKSWPIELEDCESTTKNKLWTFLPVLPPSRLPTKNDYLGLERQSIETDFETNSQEK